MMTQQLRKFTNQSWDMEFESQHHWKLHNYLSLQLQKIWCPHKDSMDIWIQIYMCTHIHTHIIEHFFLVKEMNSRLWWSWADNKKNGGCLDKEGGMMGTLDYNEYFIWRCSNLLYFFNWKRCLIKLNWIIRMHLST